MNDEMADPPEAPVSGDAEMKREMKLEALKRRIGQSEYEVDVEAVAEAIVRRVSAARRELLLGVRSVDGSRSRPSRDVLEAG
jgi:hypothetical protein